MRILFILLPILLLTAGANPVAAGIGLSPAATPLHMRAANADLIVLGRIEDVGEKDTPLTLGFGQGERTFRMGRIAITEVIHGDKQLKTAQVALTPYQINYFGKGRELDRSPVPGAPAFKPFVKGKEGLFFLTWHPWHKMWLPAQEFVYTEKDDPVYADEVARTRRLVQLLDNPTAGLKSKDGKERMTTAVLLIYQYSGAWRAHGPRTRSATIPIEAEESNLILGVLARDDWNVPPHDFRGIQASHAYHVLGLDPGALKTEAEAKAWLAQNLDTLRVRKAVPHEPEYIEDLKPAHFAKKSVWLLGGDEYYPWLASLPVSPASGNFLVRAELTLADGTKFAGFITPQQEAQPLQLGYINPHLFAPSGKVFNFWRPTIKTRANYFGGTITSFSSETIAGRRQRRKSRPSIRRSASRPRTSSPSVLRPRKDWPRAESLA